MSLLKKKDQACIIFLLLLLNLHAIYVVQSFRFGAEIAYVGATILKVCKGVQKILVGGNQKGKLFLKMKKCGFSEPVSVF